MSLCRLWLLLLAVSPVVAAAEKGGSVAEKGGSAMLVEYSGDTEKPVYPFIVANSISAATTLRDTLDKMYSSESIKMTIVDEPTMTALLDVMDRYRKISALSEKGATRHEGPTIWFTIDRPSESQAFALQPAPASRAFDEIKALCKSHNSLIEAASRFQMRISSWVAADGGH